MTADVIPFDFNGVEVRVIARNGDPWFVLADLCSALGLDQVSRVRARLDHALTSSTPIVDSLGRTQQATVVSEAGMYEVVIRSDKPEAVSFRRWVTSEVLPAIRKHGGYLTPAMTEHVLSDPDTIIRLATDLKAERAKRAELAAQVEADAPKVLFADAVAASGDTILVRELAKFLASNGIEIGGTRLYERLRNEGFLVRAKGSDYNSPTQKAMDLGLFKVKETPIVHADGHVTISRTSKVTGKGQTYFVQYFLKRGAA